MTRARFVLGTDALHERFDQIRRAVITAPREIGALRTEIIGMRDKVRAAHRVQAEMFDVKHSPGGMVDVEFVVQFLVLARSAEHPALVDNAGNIALLQRAQEVGLLPGEVGSRAAHAYRELRRVQHHARLNETPTQVPDDELQEPRAAVLALWQAVFGAPPAPAA